MVKNLLIDISSCTPPAKHRVSGRPSIDSRLTVDGEDTVPVQLGQSLSDQASLNSQLILIPWKRGHLRVKEEEEEEEEWLQINY